MLLKFKRLGRSAQHIHTDMCVWHMNLGSEMQWDGFKSDYDI